MKSSPCCAGSRAWAEWVGYILEEEGFAVIIQAWDFKPGSNFILEMHRATTEANRTIMVLSPDLAGVTSAKQ
jgi:TIR domain